MTPETALLATRFGTGLSPRIAPPVDAQQMLDWFVQGDHMARQHPLPGFERVGEILDKQEAYTQELRLQQPQLSDRDLTLAARQRHPLQAVLYDGIRGHFARWVDARDMLRERTQLFWIDHFAMRGKSGGLQHVMPTFIEDAIRPHLAGRFSDMFVAAVTHPMMVRYLDQHISVSPLSERGQSGRGLNENLARELLELHSFGVGGPYTQNDVTRMAELLAGLIGHLKSGRVYDPRRAHPRPITVLGRSYGRGAPAFSDVVAALQDIAAHPATAAHLARKLAVHFVSDTPSADLVATIEAAWRRSRGYLPEVYAALLQHPDVAQPERAKVKQPFEFLATAFRAMGRTGAELRALDEDGMKRQLLWPLTRMGQRWLMPGGPDGWPEAAEDWITPAGLSLRLDHCAMIARQMEGRNDPRVLLEDALGPLAPEVLRFAVEASESKEEGVMLVLAAPAFHRR